MRFKKRKSGFKKRSFKKKSFKGRRKKIMKYGSSRGGIRL